MHFITYCLVTIALSLFVVSVTYFILKRMKLLHTQFNKKNDGRFKPIMTLFTQKSSIHFIKAGVALPKVSYIDESHKLKGWRLSFNSEGHIESKNDKCITFLAQKDAPVLLYTIDESNQKELFITNEPITIPVKNYSIILYPSPDKNIFYGILLFPKAFDHPIYVSSNKKITSILGRTHHSDLYHTQEMDHNYSNDYVPIEDFSQPDDLIWDKNAIGIEHATLGNIRLHRKHLALSINNNNVSVKNIGTIPVYILDKNLELKTALSQLDEEFILFNDYLVIGHHVLQLKKS